MAVPERGAKRKLSEVVGAQRGGGLPPAQAPAGLGLRRAVARALRAGRPQLGLEQAPLRIECYDISNLGPTDKVASMVVFEDGLPKRSDYRRFEIKGVQGQDDFASMEEVIRRRFLRLQRERDEPVGSRTRGGSPIRPRSW